MSDKEKDGGKIPSELLKIANTRIRNPFVGSFVISYCLINWQIFIRLAFTEGAEPKINAINLITSTTHSYIAPLTVAAIYTALGPWASLILRRYNELTKRINDNRDHEYSKITTKRAYELSKLELLLAQTHLREANYKTEITAITNDIKSFMEKAQNEAHESMQKYRTEIFASIKSTIDEIKSSEIQSLTNEILSKATAARDLEEKVAKLGHLIESLAAATQTSDELESERSQKQHRPFFEKIRERKDMSAELHEKRTVAGFKAPALPKSNSNIFKYTL
jgi:hypothetical protein